MTEHGGQPKAFPVDQGVLALNQGDNKRQKLCQNQQDQQRVRLTDIRNE